MVGSGMPETYEMYQLLSYVKKVVDKYDRPVVVPAELAEMISVVNAALDKVEASGFTDPESVEFEVPSELFTYWDTVATARETYRAKVQTYFSGETHSYDASTLSEMVGLWLEQIEAGMARAIKFGSHGYGDDGYVSCPIVLHIAHFSIFILTKVIFSIQYKRYPTLLFLLRCYILGTQWTEE